MKAKLLISFFLCVLVVALVRHFWSTPTRNKSHTTPHALHNIYRRDLSVFRICTERETFSIPMINTRFGGWKRTETKARKDFLIKKKQIQQNKKKTIWTQNLLSNKPCPHHFIRIGLLSPSGPHTLCSQRPKLGCFKGSQVPLLFHSHIPMRDVPSLLL